MIKEIFDLTYAKHESSGKFSISSIGSCRRKKFLEMKGRYKEVYDQKTLRTFSTGDFFHRLACGEIMSKGEQLGLHIVASEVLIPDHPFLSGRADQIIADSKGERMIVDVKSCSSWTFDKACDGEITNSYLWQLQLYLHLFQLKKGYILFYEKSKGNVTEYEVIYDKDLCEKLIAEVKHFMEYNIAKDIEPDPCTKEISPFGCAVCGGGKKK